MQRKILNLAHRGYRARYPENTLLAFRQALEVKGCDGIELDVQLSKDGELVIMHDETLNRTTNGSGPLKDQILAGLRRLDAGEGEKIPTLDEYLDLVENRPFLTNIELKNSMEPYPGMEERVIQKVRARKMEDRVLFSSFRHDSVILCKKLAPEIPGGLLCAVHETFPGQRLDKVLRRMGENGIEYLHPGTLALSVDLLEALNEKGVAINTWTANAPGVIKRLVAEPCVRGIVTDDPALLAEMLGRGRNSC